MTSPFAPMWWIRSPVAAGPSPARRHAQAASNAAPGTTGTAAMAAPPRRGSERPARDRRPACRPCARAAPWRAGVRVADVELVHLAPAAHPALLLGVEQPGRKAEHVLGDRAALFLVAVEQRFRCAPSARRRASSPGCRRPARWCSGPVRRWADACARRRRQGTRGRRGSDRPGARSCGRPTPSDTECTTMSARPVRSATSAVRPSAERSTSPSSGTGPGSGTARCRRAGRSRHLLPCRRR